MFLTSDEYTSDDTGKECSDFFLVDNEHVLWNYVNFKKKRPLNYIYHKKETTRS